MHTFLIVNQSPTPLFRQMARMLGEQGHEVTFISGMDWPDCPANIRFVKGPRYDRSTLRGRARSWLSFLIFAARQFRTVRPGTVVLTCSNPPLLPHVAAAFLPAAAPQVVRVLDIYPDVIEKHPRLRRIPLVQGMWAALNRWAYARCAAVVTLGEHMADTLARYTPVRPLVVTNWHFLPLAEMPSGRENKFRRELGIGDRAVVLYSGNIGLAHDLQIMIEAASALRDDDRLCFVVAGEGPRKEEMVAEIARRGLARSFLFLPRQPEEVFGAVLGLGDLAVVSVVPGYERTLIPGKLYDHLAAGAAILALTRRPSDLAATVEQHGCGTVIEPGDLVAFIATIRDYLVTGTSTVGENAREAAVRHYSPQVCCTQMVQILTQVAKRRGAVGAIRG